MAGVRVTSEIGPLESVVCHTPGPELLAVTPSTKEDFLYDDLLDLEEATREHKRFRALLSRFAEVHEVADLLADVMEIEEARSLLVERVFDVTRSAPLADAILDQPGEELVRMFIEGMELEEGPLARVLNVESYALPPLPNLFFTRDAAVVVGGGVIIGSMRHSVRWTEEILMKALFTYHPALQGTGIIYDGSEERRSGYTIEGGDVHIVRPDTAIIGVSQRSSPVAFDAIAEELGRNHGIEHIIVVVLPSDRAMIHLDMVFTMVDRTHAVVFPPAFVGPDRYAVLYRRTGQASMQEMPNVFAALREVDLPLEPIFCGGDKRSFQEREQWSSGCNFVAVRPGVVLGYSRNERTYAEMEREAGFRIIAGVDYLTGEAELEEDDRAVLTFEGGELVRGGGGGRCMTLPIRRADVW
ncbi:MAG: arginine deiminase family protein [Candidatus Longimicrobiales bacterium M2_2A_002]